MGTTMEELQSLRLAQGDLSECGTVDSGSAFIMLTAYEQLTAGTNIAAAQGITSPNRSPEVRTILCTCFSRSREPRVKREYGLSASLATPVLPETNRPQVHDADDFDPIVGNARPSLA